MSVESDLRDRLATLAANAVYPGPRVHGTALPSIHYEQVGGEAIGFLGAEKPSQKNARFQVRVWASTRAEANVLARSIEDSLITSTVLRATAVGALMWDEEPDLSLYGTIQDFSIWFTD